MADVFISYATKDRDRARALAEALQSLGWTVWWDRKLRAGSDYAKVIMEALESSRCVIVLWSRESVESGWVRDEANVGLKRRALFPVLIDDVEPPMGFRSVQAAGLVGWDGDLSFSSFQELVSDLAQVLGDPPKRGGSSPPGHEPAAGLSQWPQAGGQERPAGGSSSSKRWITAGVVGALVLGLGAWGIFSYKASVDRRAAEVVAEQRALVEERRRAADEVAKSRAELEARQKALVEQQRLREAEAARRAETEKRRLAAEAEAARSAELEKTRAAADAAQREAARRVEEERRRATPPTGSRQDADSVMQKARALESAGDLDGALRLYRGAAEQGNAEAQYSLGLRYELGRGVAKDAAAAARWYRGAAEGFRKAADQGDVRAQYLLGQMYLYGRGVRKDDVAAFKLYRKAADQGNVGGQYYVGFMYANGRGVNRDDVEAAKWFRKAAEQGHGGAQYLLGDMYANGRGVPKNDTEAVRWYRIAAARGVAEAQSRLRQRGLTW